MIDSASSRFPSFRPMGFVLHVKKDASDYVEQKWRNLVSLSIISLVSQDFSTSVKHGPEFPDCVRKHKSHRSK